MGSDLSWIGSQTALSVADTFEWRKELPGMQTTVVKVSFAAACDLWPIAASAPVRSDAPHLALMA